MAQSSGPHQVADEDKIKKETGKWLFPPAALAIVWGKDDRYWRMINRGSPQQKSIAELLQVSWLEVTGSTDKIEKEKRYEISFEVSLKQDAFGWGSPVFLMAKVGKRGKYSWKKVSLQNKQGESKPFTIPATEKLIVEVPADISEGDNKLHFGLYEVWSGKWKGGLQIHNAIVKLAT